jgi:glycerol kinase
MFSASKLSSVLATDPSLRAKAEQGTACAGTVDSWLAWNLSGGELHVTDAGNASRTLLFDLETLAWSEELLELFRIPLAMLPAIVPSSGVLGMTKPQEGVPSTPLASLTADSHAALFGLGCSSPGKAKATYGTGTSLASPTGQERVRSSNGLATSVAWLMGSPTFALEGNVFSSGATVEWVSRLLGLASAADVEQLSRTTTGSGGVHLVPAFAGLGAPYWQPQARGQLSGMTFATGPAELARAAIESIAFQVSDLVAALEIDLGCPITELRVDGGATQNNALMQLQADLLGCPVVRTSVSDAAALGAAVMAGMATGVFDGPDLETMTRECEVIEPQIPESSRAELRAGWNDAVRHATVNCAGAAAS